jgi:hypothetical protein
MAIWDVESGSHKWAEGCEGDGFEVWVPTHDEIVTSTRGYSWVLRERKISVAEALKKEENEKGEKRKTKGFEFVVIGNGGSFVLA